MGEGEEQRDAGRKGWRTESVLSGEVVPQVPHNKLHWVCGAGEEVGYGVGSPLPHAGQEGSGMRPIAALKLFLAMQCPERSCDGVIC